MVKKKWRSENKDRINFIKKQWRDNNKERVSSQQRKDALKRMYGITLEQFQEIIIKQNNKCAICNKKFNTSSLNSKPHVDHNHATGKIRDLLCGNCNNGLGLFYDNIIYINNASNYLIRHST